MIESKYFLHKVITQSFMPLIISMLENCISELKVIQNLPHEKIDINIHNIFNQNLCYLDTIKGMINVLQDINYEYSE